MHANAETRDDIYKSGVFSTQIHEQTEFSNSLFVIYSNSSDDRPVFELDTITPRRLIYAVHSSEIGKYTRGRIR